jgi:hypothetical protein
MPLIARLVLIVFVAVVSATSGRAVELQPGDILVVSGQQDVVVRVDASTGARTFVSLPDDSAVFSNSSDLVIDADGSLLVSNESGVIRVDPETGVRTIVTTLDLVGQCNAVHDPFLCCTGSGTGDGTPPCVAVGSGPAIAGFRGVAVVPPTSPATVSALPPWGLAVLVGVLIGLTVREARSGAIHGG